MLPNSYYNEEDIRKRQIDTLKIFNDNVTEIKEYSEYKVDFIADSIEMSLNVILSPEFPQERPKIYVHPPVPHLWLAENSDEVVGAPGLLNYTIHSDLGRIVQAIIREFQKHLPNLNLSDERTQSPSEAVNPQSLFFPELNDLTIEELHEILENPDLQDKLLESNQQLLELDKETEKLMASIEQIAQSNLGKQQSLDNLKTDVIDQISNIVQMKLNYEELNRKYVHLTEAFDPHRIKNCLRGEALKADEEAELIAEQFLIGNMPVEEFVAQFAEKRALGQARRAREERLSHQLAQLDKATI